MLHLVHVGLVPLLMFIQFPLEALDFLILVLHFFLSSQLQVLLELLHPFGTLLFLFRDPQLKLLLLHLVEVPQLCQRTLTLDLHLLYLVLHLSFLLFQL
mmetsp:Transcript_22939/g.22252  ORF Transcript_22939/g.22252 Transcript_22939/m.22252 type:complete len:99 (-) Transcript_22939:1249-1545(-)